MKTARLEAFSDGVIAIIVTIMVLELKVPHDEDLASLLKLWPTLASYILSFGMVSIYWVNHHHLVHWAKEVTAAVLWSNLHLLFWLSLVPFATAYLGETHATNLAVALYSAVSLGCCLAFALLRKLIADQQRRAPELAALQARMHKKIVIATVLNSFALLAAFYSTPISFICLLLPPLMYFIPD